MITHFEAIITLLGAVLGILVTLVTVVWKARGYVDRLNSTDSRLATAIEGLATSQTAQHAENQERFRAIEARLPPPPRHGRANAVPAPPGR